MGIQPTSAYTTLSLLTNSPQLRQTSTSATATSAASAASFTDKATISQAARDRAAEETEGAGAYDFTNVRPSDVLGIVNSLLKSGKIPLDESSSLLSFVPLTELNAAMGKPGIANEPINLFSGLKASIVFNQSIDNDEAVIYDQKALSALERLQGTR